MTHPISPAQRAAVMLELLDHSPELGARATLFGCPVELTFPHGLEDGWTLEGLRNRLRYEVSLAAATPPATPRVADPSSDSGPGNPSTQAAPEEASASARDVCAVCDGRGYVPFAEQSLMAANCVTCSGTGQASGSARAGDAERQAWMASWEDPRPKLPPDMSWVEFADVSESVDPARLRMSAPEGPSVPAAEVLLHERGLLRAQVAVLARRLTDARAELAAERNVVEAATALARGNGDDAIRAEEAARTAGADTLTAWADELQAEADELPEYAHGEYWRCLNDRISETRARATGLVTR